MKRGCFFTSIFVLTLAIGIGFYLYKKYYPQIENYGKEKIIQVSLDEITKKIAFLSESKYNDSLKIFLFNQSEILKKQNIKDAVHNFGNIIDQAKSFMEDNSVDSVEFGILKNMAIKR